MTTIQPAINSPATTRLFSFAFALMMIVFGLATTGCDTLDSNAVEDESPNVMFSSKSGEPHMLAAQDFQYTGSATSALDGTWELVSENAAQAHRVTFATSATQEEGKRFIGQLSGETECSDFSGDFRARDPQLEINMVNVAAARCNPFAEEDVIKGLREATSYRLDKGFLVIYAGQDTPALVFKPAETKSEDDGVPELLGPPVPADDDDKTQPLGPPVPADDADQDVRGR